MPCARPLVNLECNNLNGPKFTESPWRSPVASKQPEIPSSLRATRDVCPVTVLVLPLMFIFVPESAYISYRLCPDLEEDLLAELFALVIAPVYGASLARDRPQAVADVHWVRADRIGPQHVTVLFAVMVIVIIMRIEAAILIHPLGHRSCTSPCNSVWPQIGSGILPCCPVRSG